MFWIYLIEFVLSAVLAGWHYAWPTWLRLAGQAPDLVVILLVSVGLTRGPLEGCWAGFSSGLMIGALGQTPLGGLFVSHIGAGTVLGLLGGRIFPNHIFVAMLVTATTVIAMNLVELLFIPPAHFLPWMTAIFVQAFVSSIVAAPLFALLRALFSYLPLPAER